MSLPQVLGGIGLASQLGNNKKDQSAAQQQLALQQRQINAQLGAYSNYMDQVGQLQQEGAFNPQSRLQELNQQGQHDLNDALSSEAGAARALGYRPGDTVPLTQMNQTMGDYQLQQEQAANQILNQSTANYLAALQGAPSLSDLGAGIGATGENARVFLGEQTSPLGMLQSLGQSFGQGLGQSGRAPTAYEPNSAGLLEGITTSDPFWNSFPNVVDVGASRGAAPAQSQLAAASGVSGTLAQPSENTSANRAMNSGSLAAAQPLKARARSPFGAV